MVSIELAAVTASLLFIIVFEAITLARSAESTLVTREKKELRDLKYETDGSFSNYIPWGFVRVLFGPVYRLGPFGYIHFLIEITLALMLFVWLLIDLPSGGLIQSATTLPAAFGWILLPLLTVTEYDEILSNGLRPRSLEYHFFMTLILLLLVYIIGQAEYWVPYVDPLAAIIALVFLSVLAVGLFLWKIAGFFSYLEEDLRELQP